MNCLMFLAQAAANDWWSEQLFGLDQEQRFVLLLVGIGCVTAIFISTVAIISGVFSTIHRRRNEADLKRELIDRGMSADEISKIVEASPCEDFLSRWAKGQKQ